MGKDQAKVKIAVKGPASLVSKALPTVNPKATGAYVRKKI